MPIMLYILLTIILSKEFFEGFTWHWQWLNDWLIMVERRVAAIKCSNEREQLANRSDHALY